MGAIMAGGIHLPGKHFATLTVSAAALLAGQAAWAQDTQTTADGTIGLDRATVDTLLVIGSVPVRNRTDSVAPELVYDQTFFQRFEPLSVGDALKRVPGVSFATDVGEFDDPGFRGLANGFTQILINGRPVTSAGGGDANTRTVFVDRIPAELVERIEIIRSPGADIDSQGVAGTINIVLKDGANLPEGGFIRGTGIRYFPNISDNDGTWRGTGAIGYTGRALNDKLSYSLNLNVQQRFNEKFSVQEVFDPDNFASVDEAADALAIDGANSVIGDGEERTVQADARRNLDIGLNGNASYRTEAGHTFGFSGFYLRTDRDEREDELVFEDAPDNLVEITAQDTEFAQDNFGVEGTADFVLNSQAKLGLRVGFNRFDNEIVQTDFELDAEDIEGTPPTELTFRDNFTVAPFNPEADEQEVFDTIDEELQLDGTLDWNLQSFADRIGFTGVDFKTGVQLRFRERDSSLLVFGFDDGVLEADDPEAADLGGIFTIEENRFDSFFLFDWQITQRLALETGVRFEVTETDQVGFANGEQIEASASDFEPNPSAHLRYEFVDGVRFRASYARTVRRPAFNQRVPFVIDDQPDDLDTIQGNPDLELETANGFDSGFEFDLPGGGILGINGFYRDISDIIQQVDLGPNGNEELDDGDLIIGDAFTFENVGDAIAYGFEFDVSTPLTFFGLPNTGIFANYTLLRSEVDNVFVGGGSVRINDQPRFVYNVGATHDFVEQGITVGFSYQDQGEAESTFLDEIETSNFTANLEAFVEKRIGDNVVVRLSGSNLLDAETLQTEENFDGPITGGDLDNFEIEREEAQQRILFTVRAAF